MNTIQSLQEAPRTNDNDQSALARFQLGFEYVVDPVALEIYPLLEDRLGEKRKVEPRIMEVLVQLAAHYGQVVSSDDLIERVWDNYGGGKEALMQTISKLRKLLGDDAQQQRTIQTISKKGYRLLLPIRKLEPDTYISAYEQKRTVSVGLFTGFVERLTKPKFFLAFLFLSIVVLMLISRLSYLIFWLATMVD